MKKVLGPDLPIERTVKTLIRLGGVQIDLSLLLAHMPFLLVFIMRRLNYCNVQLDSCNLFARRACKKKKSGPNSCFVFFFLFLFFYEGLLQRFMALGVVPNCKPMNRGCHFYIR